MKCTHPNLIPGLQSFCPTCRKSFEPWQQKENYQNGKRTATKSATTPTSSGVSQGRQGLEQKRTRSSRQQKTQSDYRTDSSVDQQGPDQASARRYIQTVLSFDTSRTNSQTVLETSGLESNLDPQNTRCRFSYLWAGEVREFEGELIENFNNPAGMVEVKYEADGQERQSQIWVWNLIKAPNLVQLLETERDHLRVKATQFPWSAKDLNRVEKRLTELFGSQAPSSPAVLSHHPAGIVWLDDEIARLEVERDRIRAEGPISPRGAWIEKYAAKRKRKKSPPKIYIYYRLRQREGTKHQSLGKLGSPKCNAAKDAIARRNALERIERRIKILEKCLEEQDQCLRF